MPAVAVGVGAGRSLGVEQPLQRGQLLAGRREVGAVVQPGVPALAAAELAVADTQNVDRPLHPVLAGGVEEALVGPGHARVEPRDADPGVVDPGRIAGGAGAHAHHAGGRLQRADGLGGGPVRRDALHVAALGDLDHLVRRQQHRQRVHRHESVEHRSAGGQHAAAQRGQLGLAARRGDHQYLDVALAVDVLGPVQRRRGRRGHHRRQVPGKLVPGRAGGLGQRRGGDQGAAGHRQAQRGQGGQAQKLAVGGVKDGVFADELGLMAIDG